MNTTTHPVAPEDVMALLDGELSGTEANSVSAHLGECSECSELAAQFRLASQSLAAWTVPAAPAKLDDAVNKIAEKAASVRNSNKPETYARSRFWNLRLWAVGGAGAAVATLAVVLCLSIFYRRHSMEEARTVGQPEQLQASAEESRSAGIAGNSGESSSGIAELNAYKLANSLEATPRPAPPPATQPPAQAAPMIARSVNLTIQVKDFAASRAALDAVLARHHGYAAQLTVNTPENDARSFQASLRIPAPELAAAIAEIRTLGRVEVETQSGEEVTQQHADLVARLQNSRETEQRLRDLLAQRTGKIEEVLQVEEEIDRVRGEIENMEAEQKTLEHRVDFASVDLQLTEEYKEQFNPQPTSVSGSMHNAFVAGLRHATGALLGIVLFLEEFGPVLLIWVVILGAPAVWGWRRYRKARAKF